MATSTSKASRTVRGSDSKSSTTTPSVAPATAGAAAPKKRGPKVGAAPAAQTKRSKKRVLKATPTRVTKKAAAPPAVKPAELVAAAPAVERFYVTMEGKTALLHLGRKSLPAKAATSKAILSMMLELENPKRHVTLSGSPQAAGSMPKEVEQYLEIYKKPDMPKAKMTRKYFRDHKRWGYSLAHGGQEVGQLVYDSKQVWALFPTSKELEKAGMEPSVHRNPVGAFVRLTTTWHEALTPDKRQHAAA
ncbi:hypothetical protein ACVIGB_000408 [Bradyrhizobium sp. USDA 4341]